MGLFLQLAWYVIQFMFVGGTIPITVGESATSLEITQGGVWGAFINFALQPNHQIMFLSLIMWIIIAVLGKIERVFKI